MLCYHCRIISIDHCRRKSDRNFWHKRNGFSLDDLLRSDHADVRDTTLMQKSLRRHITALQASPP